MQERDIRELDLGTLFFDNLINSNQVKFYYTHTNRNFNITM